MAGGILERFRKGLFRRLCGLWGDSSLVEKIDGSKISSPAAEASGLDGEPDMGKASSLSAQNRVQYLRRGSNQGQKRIQHPCDRAMPYRDC